MSTVILWASEVFETNKDGRGLLGPPKNNPLGLGKKDFVTVGGFTGTYHRDLHKLLQVPPATLYTADVIAFEGNGGSPGPSGGWESCHWSFSDGTSRVDVAFDESIGAPVPAEVVANGSVDADRYADHFGVARRPDSRVVSFLLFQLPNEIDLGNPALRIRVAGGGDLPGEGTPDPDAIGVFPCFRALSGRVTRKGG